MKELALLIIAFLAAMSGDAAADRDPNNNEPRALFGEGTSSCGTWTVARQQRSVTAGRAAQWVAGYLSGVNTTSDKPDVLSGLDFDAMVAFVDNYCSAHPLDPIAGAAIVLMMELRRRHPQAP
jgi:hypothetical protein